MIIIIITIIIFFVVFDLSHCRHVLMSERILQPVQRDEFHQHERTQHQTAGRRRPDEPVEEEEVVFRAGGQQQAEPLFADRPRPLQRGQRREDTMLTSGLKDFGYRVLGNVVERHRANKLKGHARGCKTKSKTVSFIFTYDCCT